jgi:hypothetical protein
LKHEKAIPRQSLSQRVMIVPKKERHQNALREASPIDEDRDEELSLEKGRHKDRSVDTASEDDQSDPVRRRNRRTKKKKKRRNRQAKLSKLLNLPNVHAGLHLAENAREYATIMNCNVLAGELKHK